MEYKVSAFKVIINGVKAYSWIIRSLVNNGCNPNALAELDYNTGVIAFDIYIYIFGRLGLVMRVIGLYGRAGYYQGSVS